MDRITRHELKKDKFAAEVGHSLEFVQAHRRQVVRYGAAGLIVVLLVLVGYYVRRYQAAGRQQALASALRIKDGVVGVAPQPGDPRPSFGSQTEKDSALRKALQDIASRYPGTNEASVASYQLGVIAADEGKLDEAARHFQAAVEAGNADYSSVSRLSLAQVYAAQGKTAEAEKQLRTLIASPTVLVSKEQATFTLARILAGSNPAEARKLLDPYQKDQRVAIARNAGELLAQIPAK